jgi:diaminohydroxyphosphoribosylaminopyrimidine deaminase/5-amino-6-(5-phosphoribosylamino)uracil reductase
MTPGQAFMQRAIQLARMGRGRVEPNPMVGAVVVRDGRIIGEGYHERFGQTHAEVNALARAGEAARGADIYVTLEPCCRHGKQPPCTEALLAAGVARVFIGASDPTQGRAVGVLRGAGVEVIEGVEREECERLAAPFLKLRLRRRPYVTAKWAMTADGKIATTTGDSRWISGAAARRMAHYLRYLSDAVAIGIETALTDDPLMTCRLPGGRTPCRVVFDARCRLPLDSRLVRTAAQAPVLVLARHPESEAASALRAAGCEVVDLAGRAELDRLDAALAVLAEREMTHVLIEGGAQVLTAAFECKAVDEVCIFVAPKLIGGSEAPTPLAGSGIAAMSEAIELVEPTWRVVGGDAVLCALVRYPATR